MKISTSRFGELEVDKKDIILFKEGILGFESLKKFFIVDPGDQTLILWLQSIDSSLSLENLNDVSVYTILTIPSNVTEMSANLKAPIIINNKTKEARQIVLQDNKLEVRYPMYMDLKKYIVTYTSSDDSKRTSVTISAEVESKQADEVSSIILSTEEMPNQKKTINAL